MTEHVDSYWDLMADVARLQGQLGEDLVAWAKMYEAGGRALERSGRTLGAMAELGRRMEHHLEAGPPAAVTQILRMFSGPWPGLGMGMGMGAPPGTPSAAGPFAQLFETWTSSMVPPEPPRTEKGP